MVAPKLIRIHAAVIVLAIGVLAPHGTFAVSASAETPARVALSDIKIDNFGMVDANYFRGSAPSDGQYAKLAALGVKMVIDLRGSDVQTEDRSLVERSGMKYTHIPMNTRVEPSAAQIQTFMELVSDPANQPVYVHCVGGKHRTGVMTAVYRMIHDGWTADQAFKEMKDYKFGADFLHPEFKRFVYGYQPPAPAVLPGR